MANLFRANKKGSGDLAIDSLTVTQMPEKTIYLLGENLDFTGLKVKAIAGALEGEVTNLADYNPPEGTEITTEGTHTINVSYLGANTSFDIIGAIRPMLKKLPYNFYDGSAVVFNNEIHILGGVNSGSSHNTSHYKWNGSAWIEVSTLPYNFYYGSAVVYNNEIHILGSAYSGNYSKHYKWNGSAWTEVSTLPYQFYGGSAVVYNNEIHILSSNNFPYHYKWNGTAWTKVSTLPYGFVNRSAVVYNNEIHILGGNVTQSYTHHLKWNGSAWTDRSIYSTL